MSGVAKSAKEAPNRRRMEFPIPGNERGIVIVRNILHREDPRESAASSRLALIVFRTAVITINATGKYVRVSLIQVPIKPYMEKSVIPKALSNIPFGPRAKVREILLVKGGEMRGRIVTAPNSALKNAGRGVLVTANAKIYPSTVPVTATAVARVRELMRALML
jgi:hypothetical protein